MTYEEMWNRNRVEWLYQLARHEALGPAAVRVGLLFGTFFQPEEREELRPRYEWLADNGRMSRGTVSSALDELEKAEMLVIERMHRYRNTYRMPFDGTEVWKRIPVESKN